MTLQTLDIARLASAFGTQAVARVKDDTARAMARTLTASARSEAIAHMEDSANAFRGYSADDTRRMETLMGIAWPRTRAVRSAMDAADAAARIAHRDRDAAALYDAVLRAHRLSVLLAACNRRAASVGAFPVSRDDMHAATSRFMVKARWRRFMFAGGRDRVSSLHDDADVLQGAFLRALDAQDTVSGVPTFGGLFRHVQAERAHLTRIAGAEWRGVQDSLHGVKGTERAYAATDDTHTLRRLGCPVPAPHTHSAASGRMFGTLETHRAALAIAHVEVERAGIAEYVTREARNLATLAAPRDAFPRVLSEVLMAGATLDEVSDALGLTVGTLKERAAGTRLAAMASGIDHVEDDTHSAERERDVMHTQARHAERCVSSRALAYRSDYMRAAIARRRGVSAMDAGRNAARRDNLADAVTLAGERVAATGYRSEPSTGEVDAAIYARVIVAAEREAIPYAAPRVYRAIASSIIRAGLDATRAAAYATLADAMTPRTA